MLEQQAISTPPKLDARAVCITDDPILAAVISSYFAQEGLYLTIFEFHKIKEPPKGVFAPISLEILRVHINNRILLLMPEKIIFAGLNDFQKSCFKFPKELIVDIHSLQEVDQKIWDYSNKSDRKIRCREENVQEGLLNALRSGSCLVIDPEAELITNEPYRGEGVVVIEKEETDISVICAINLAFATKSNVEFIEGANKQDAYITQKNLLAAWDGLGDHSLDDEKVNLKQRISKIDFQKYKWATFLTRGVPYSFVLNDVLPTALLYRVAATHIIFDSLFKEEFTDYLYSSVFFSVPVKKTVQESVVVNDESPEIAALLDHSGYFNIMLANKYATKRNFSFFVEYFPYDILHISSHGGGIKDGMFRRVTLKDTSGKEHKFDYYETADFETTGETNEEGEPLIGVTSMTVPVAFDGYPWASEELFANRTSEEIKTVENIFSEKSSIREKIDFSLPVKDFEVPHSKRIDCIDNIHQGNFHGIGGQTSPFVFNNSCCSWYEMGTSFVAIGARAYIGTLFRILDSVAKESAIIFYKNALNNNLDLMTSCFLTNKSITNPRYKDIYIFWGIPWSFIRTSNQSRALVVKDLIDTIRDLVVGYKRHLDEKEGSLLKKTQDIINFLEEKIHTIPTMYWKSIEIRYGAGMRIFRRIVGK